MKICRRNKYGYCKYGDTCHFRHEKEICKDNKCNIFNCLKRHPKVCSWFQEYGRCKFMTYCKFKHPNINNFDEIVDKIEMNENKLDEINKMLKIIEKEEVEIKQKIEAYENEVEKRLNMFEIKLNKVYEILDEKDCIIASLKASLQKTQESLEKFSLEKESKRINDLDEAEAPISKFKCSSCDYLARSSNGLKSHISRKHKKYDESVNFVVVNLEMVKI